MPELTWRTLRAADALAWAALMRAIPHRDRPVDHVETAEFVRNLTAPGVDEADSMGVFAGPELVGCSIVLPTADGNRCDVEGGVHPGHRGQGLGGRLLDWAVARVAQRSPQPQRVGVWCAEHNDAHRKLLARRGLRPSLHYHEVYSRLETVAPLPAPSLPGGLELRHYTTDLDEAVRAAHNDAFSGQHEDGHVDRERWRRDFTGCASFLPELSFVVLDARGVVAAHLLSYAHDASPHTTGQRDLKVEYIGTRPGFRGRFLDRVLLAENDRVARERGYVGMAFSVDSANPTGALRVFERIGVYDPERDDCTTWVLHEGVPLGPEPGAAVAAEGGRA
ncbi:ribosomal protein S18 acetylase RimI-like enzyme [Saccharopolyspora erythraea NRRL 2338]|uniref:GCN5-related N-acetyltransferase n=2 Tax=Saccharopolyspora erythraea TaxID=1836 RepID=A4FHS7_SACEN|nr:GNAT family N-acetyltransferase [Saccharopolyspora erythraea]EQD82233.1 GCN5 family acetyltransferase [Saccharopolyspora erythraea D]PFG97289.1 ribosomal protein S18 acetylase RimI-like enzyme [Saccharopolyspora erythraea NRRL 2338]QRK87481.1 GNAT family N-acetyltransferase [Saccharopolyspora erythraea]CAM03602.1 GCN5-related N-acetyltransferase [Saccharopolyspora erythraea NRRL 2338]